MSDVLSKSNHVNQHLLDELEAQGLIKQTDKPGFECWDYDKSYVLTVKYFLSIWDKGVLAKEQKDVADDWLAIFPEGYIGHKFSAMMFSPSLQRLRHKFLHEVYV